MIFTGIKLGIACGHTTVVPHSWLAFFVINSQLTKAGDKFVCTSDRSRSMYTM